MNFNLTEEHLAVQEAAKNFAESECKPGVIERDREQKVGLEQLKQLKHETNDILFEKYKGKTPQKFWYNR